VSTAPILVTGAAGRQGNTGRSAVAELVKRQHRVRAMVRTRDHRADHLADLGAEVVVADFTEYDSLLAALDGVDSAYFCYPVAPGITEAAGLFAAAGREAGLSTVVDLSLAGADPRNPSPQIRAQWVAEQIFEQAGFAGVHLRIAAFFMENLIAVHGDQIRASGVIRNAFGDHEPSWIAGEDVGAMAAALLVDPSKGGARTVTARAAARWSHRAIAEIITEVVGRAVRYEEITPDEWRAELIADAEAAGRPPNARGAAHLAAQATTLRSKPVPPVGDDVRRLTGRDPIGFAEFVRANRDLLTPRP